MPHIDKIGLEIEGGWGGEAKICPFTDVDLLSDHSVDGRMQPADKKLTSVHVGEVVSPPFPVLPSVVWRAWLREHWPTETNITCGYHIHISLKSLKDYSLLTKKGFLFTLQKKMYDLATELKLPPKHYIWNRIDGGSQFAKYSCDTTRQLGIRQKRVADPVRYGFLNFCYRVHGTVEFRALPTFENADLAIRFTNEYITTVEEYLDAQPSDNPRHVVALAFGPTGTNQVNL